MRPNVKEIVELVLKKHPPECIFKPDTVDIVCTYMARLPDNLNSEKIIKELSYIIDQCEIYCPHEGIDRR